MIVYAVAMSAAAFLASARLPCLDHVAGAHAEASFIVIVVRVYPLDDVPWLRVWLRHR